MNRSNPEGTPARLEHLHRLGAIMQRGLDLAVGAVVADIGDGRLSRRFHPTSEMYLRQWWGMSPRRAHQLIRAAEIADSSSPSRDVPPPTSGARSAAEAPPHALTPLRTEGPKALANLWEQARRELGDDGVHAVDIRLTVHKRERNSDPNPATLPNRRCPSESQADTSVPQLRWLLTQSSSAVADLVRRLEPRAAALEEGAREQLRSELLVLDDELATLRVLLAVPRDWNAEYQRLLSGEIPPFEDDDEQDYRDQAH